MGCFLTMSCDRSRAFPVCFPNFISISCPKLALREVSRDDLDVLSTESILSPALNEGLV